MQTSPIAAASQPNQPADASSLSDAELPLTDLGRRLARVAPVERGVLRFVPAALALIGAAAFVFAASPH